ncbi:MAG: hypothetical protein K2X91_15820, partial [Thermoleophilia bacterium]|nr:hypothetical protein [Thermoleophilia bacterium]
EEAPESLLGHLDVLQDIRDEDGAAVVTVLLFVRTSDEEVPTAPPAIAWLERSEAPRLSFEPLSPDSVVDYIERRLRRAGYRGSPLFTPRAALAIHAETAGVPGAVSRLCDQLLTEAAARRLRSIDEPFVRTRQQTPRALAALAADDVDTAWDDADHHPRETTANELLIEHAIALAPAPTPAAGSGEHLVADPALEAYLSAPPTEAELRAIRGGFVRRALRPLALASGAVVLGGLLLALLFGGKRTGSDGGADARETAGRPAARLHPSADPGVGLPVDTSGVGPGGAQLPVLGRLRGPVPPTAPQPTRNPRATPTTIRAGEAMAGGATPLVPAGELDDEGIRRDPRAVTEQEEEESEAPDFRPPNLSAPARLDDSDL